MRQVQPNTPKDTTSAKPVLLADLYGQNADIIVGIDSMAIHSKALGQGNNLRDIAVQYKAKSPPTETQTIPGTNPNSRFSAALFKNMIHEVVVELLHPGDPLLINPQWKAQLSCNLKDYIKDDDKKPDRLVQLSCSQWWQRKTLGWASSTVVAASVVAGAFVTATSGSVLPLAGGLAVAAGAASLILKYSKDLWWKEGPIAVTEEMVGRVQVYEACRLLTGMVGYIDGRPWSLSPSLNAVTYWAGKIPIVGSFLPEGNDRLDIIRSGIVARIKELHERKPTDGLANAGLSFSIKETAEKLNREMDRMRIRCDWPFEFAKAGSVALIVGYPAIVLFSIFI